MYKIKPYQIHQANRLGVEIKPSIRNFSKIDVFKDGQYITSIGDIRYGDYATYLEQDQELAERRRELYWNRHKKDKGVKGFYAKHILW